MSQNPVVWLSNFRCPSCLNKDVLQGEVREKLRDARDLSCHSRSVQSPLAIAEAHPCEESPACEQMAYLACTVASCSATMAQKESIVLVWHGHYYLAGTAAPCCVTMTQKESIVIVWHGHYYLTGTAAPCCVTTAWNAIQCKCKSKECKSKECNAMQMQCDHGMEGVHRP